VGARNELETINKLKTVAVSETKLGPIPHRIANGVIANFKMKIRILITLIYLSSSLNISAQTTNNAIKKDWCYITSTGKLKILGFSYNEEFHDNLASVLKDGKWGFVDTNGKIVIPLEYDLTNGFHNKLATVEKNGKWGYIDTTGRVVINIQYDYVNNFSYGLAAVGKDDKYGYIDENGNYKIAPIFDYGRDFNFYITAVKLNDKWGYIDTSGKIVTPIIYGYANEFKEGFGVVVKMSKGCQNLPKSLLLQKIKCKEKYGYADTTGRVNMTDYDYAEDFKNGFSRVFKTPWWKLRWDTNIHWKKIDKNFKEFDIIE